MATISIKISATEQHTFSLSAEKVKYLLKFINAIADDQTEEDNLLQQITKGLQEVKAIQDGKQTRKTLKDMLDGK